MFERPRAILIVSANDISDMIEITADEQHDYKVPGSPELANLVQTHLARYVIQSRLVNEKKLKDVFS
jgi:aromatic ring-opening dioxygenase catalytic subunit (LigB family)